MQDLSAKREKFLQEAADCELIGNLARDPKKRETFRTLAKQLRKMAADIGAEITSRERRPGTTYESNGAVASADRPAQS